MWRRKPCLLAFACPRLCRLGRSDVLKHSSKAGDMRRTGEVCEFEEKDLFPGRAFDIFARSGGHWPSRVRHSSSPTLHVSWEQVAERTAGAQWPLITVRRRDRACCGLFQSSVFAGCVVAAPAGRRLCAVFYGRAAAGELWSHRRWFGVGTPAQLFCSSVDF